MKSKFQEALEHIERMGEIDFIIRSYSGRGMYGRKCLGIIVENMREISLIIYCLGKDYSEEDFFPQIDTIQTDNMGLSMIAYFPYVEYVDDKNVTEETEED